MMGRTETIVSLVFVAILAWWLGFVLILPWADAQMAVLAGVVLGVGTTVGLRDSVVVRGAVAVLEPLGVVLPILALRHMAVTAVPEAGPVLGDWSGWELLTILLAYLGFLAGAMGVFRLSLYPLGYRAGPVAGMVLALCILALLAGNLTLAVVAVAGQAMWVLRLGSSNWFDHVLHVLLVPVIVVELVLRAL
ncbi:hypothetical protein K1T73_14305 [Roseovarius sp. SCSIO 43702]|uniref:hypothetical protein n=1 Tax=Roseovarius sp. SCSIO 43702 TaxID=2823043 RepID=UPI001C72D7E0|nr:hypothetical protein [Roseovarius sp. SCSIO 43702]QYX56217.1 hypothetical protein K1T73_14305 [Roseovarius sp. SCSIO 43702]